MSTKGSKGKGKSRGGGAQRHSRSRNTTPASGSVFSADTMLSTGGPDLTYDEVMEKYNLVGSSSTIPSSASLSALGDDLRMLRESAKATSKRAEFTLRDLTVRLTARKQETDAAIELEKSRKAAAEDAERKEKKKKKMKTETGDNKRPPVIGAHKATGQGPHNDGVAQREKKQKAQMKAESPDIKRNDSSSPSELPEDTEHQPPPAAPYVVFEPLEDDPAIYEIPAVTSETSYEDKAKAFAVARFPADDLSTLIPGDPPDEDFSKTKPNNQVAIGTFNGYIDPYFRPFSEEDLAFLRERGDKATPYIMPKLGRHYSEQWIEEDGASSFASPAPPTNSHNNRSANQAKGKPEDVSEDNLDKEEVSCGPLLSRVLAAFIAEEPEDEGEPNSSTQVNGDSTPAPSRQSATSLPGTAELNWKYNAPKSDYSTLDERVRREMIYVGLLDASQEVDFDNSEDDEVSARLRLLQTQLREQSTINGARKARIAEHLKEQMAYQEYVTILDDLDKQVEQAYSKRSRNMKATKKKKNVPNGAGVAQARIGIGEQARMLMERRKRWVQTIGPVFDSDLTVLPKDSIFNSIEELVELERQGALEVEE